MIDHGPSYYSCHLSGRACGWIAHISWQLGLGRFQDTTALHSCSLQIIWKMTLSWRDTLCTNGKSMSMVTKVTGSWILQSGCAICPLAHPQRHKIMFSCLCSYSPASLWGNLQSSVSTVATFGSYMVTEARWLLGIHLCTWNNKIRLGTFKDDI